jgi:RNA polymerase sigma factor (sigma-70 family)
MNEPTSADESIIGPLEDRMIGSIWRIVRDEHDAQDAMQDALATIWKQWRRVERHVAPQALVLKICVQAAYDVARRRNRQRRKIEPAPAEPIDLAPSAAEELSQRETYAAVIDALARLSSQQAVAFSLRVFDELPYDQVAAALGCAEVTARKHVGRARASLRTALARYQSNRISGSQP